MNKSNKDLLYGGIYTLRSYLSEYNKTFKNEINIFDNYFNKKNYHKLIEHLEKLKQEKKIIYNSYELENKLKSSRYNYDEIKYITKSMRSSSVIDNLINLIKEYEKEVKLEEFRQAREKAQQQQQQQQLQQFQQKQQQQQIPKKQEQPNQVQQKQKIQLKSLFNNHQNNKPNQEAEKTNEFNKLTDEANEIIRMISILNKYKPKEQFLINQRYTYLVTLIHKYIVLKSEPNINQVDKITLDILEKNNPLNILKKYSTSNTNDFSYNKIINDINEKLINDLDEIFSFNKSNYYEQYTNYYNEEERDLDKEHKIPIMTCLMPIEKIVYLYNKYSHNISMKSHEKNTINSLQIAFAKAIQNNPKYKAISKNNGEEAIAENYFICASYFNELPIKFSNKQELYQYLIEKMNNNKRTKIMCSIIEQIPNLKEYYEELNEHKTR